MATLKKTVRTEKEVVRLLKLRGHVEHLETLYREKGLDAAVEYLVAWRAVNEHA